MPTSKRMFLMATGAFAAFGASSLLLRRFVHADDSAATPSAGDKTLPRTPSGDLGPFYPVEAPLFNPVLATPRREATSSCIGCRNARCSEAMPSCKSKTGEMCGLRTALSMWLGPALANRIGATAPPRAFAEKPATAFAEIPARPNPFLNVTRLSASAVVVGPGRGSTLGLPRWKPVPALQCSRASC
jgi:hypothetical protein